MLNLGSIAFAAPWLLAALAVLPVLWWLLRVTPPAPRIVAFPAIRLLRELTVREETPAHTPLWLLILRLLIAALIILALARPVLNPDAALPGSGPLLLLVDNGWAAGRDWPARQELAERLVDHAGRQDRAVAVLATARPAAGEPPQLLGPMPAAEARRAVQSLEPQPWPTDREGVLVALHGYAPRGGHAVWLSDGLDDPASARLQERLQRIGGLELVAQGGGAPPLLLRPPVAEGDVLTVPVERAPDALPLPVAVRAVGPDGRLLAHGRGDFAPGAGRAEIRLDLPTELRNEAAAVRLEGQTSAGATLLLDERWRRRPVGLVSGRAGESQPLLSDLYYLEQALAPYTEVRRGTVEELLQRETAVLVLTDVGNLSLTESERITAWVEKGGTLLRFAGPLLALGDSGPGATGVGQDRLVPVRLRTGDRALGGALSWSEPARLAPFAEDSPFAGLAVPDDVTVSRQVLAEPSVDLAGKSWARLADGTPLVTAETRGDGRVVLVHTTAGPDWSNLALSGLYVEMLRRVVTLSAGVGAVTGGKALPPVTVLDGLGRLADPPPTAFPLDGAAAVTAAASGAAPVGPRHPPGLYGTPEAAMALNLAGAVKTLAPLQPMPGVSRGDYAGRGERDLMPALLTAALVLAIADLFIGLALRGLLGLPRFAARQRGAGPVGAVLLAALLLGSATDVRAAADDDQTRAITAATGTWLAYVDTGDAEADAVSRAGLEGLSEQLGRRTAVETAGAMAVDLESDELAFFPLIYWPVTDGQPALSETARQRLNDYLRQGGMLLIDTRDQGFTLNAGGGERLMRLTQGLDIPPLAPVPPDHVLTKAFYLLQDFPGRHAGGQVWVEAAEGRVNDGVSGVVIGANDWAGAWAVDSRGRPLFSAVPGDERQREMAYRFGVNLVMYALTGNYKADQVHVPAILERLGQ